MATQIRARDLGLFVGELEPGARNKISDVNGVLVGHETIDTTRHKTGVTVVVPAPDNVFLNKVTAAAHVLNGFGKTLGLVQVQELGTLETPLALTNTLNVGLVHDALVQYTIDRCKSEGYEARSINPVVCECNDATLNDIQVRAVKEGHVLSAIQNACADFEEGDVGGGKGMVCYGFKGGIGSASRLIPLDGQTFTLGVLVQANYGRTADLAIQGNPVGKSVPPGWGAQQDLGSIIIIVATDLPLDSRQLGRVIKRAGLGMASLGSIMGHGSGEIIIGFTTENRVHHVEGQNILTQRILREDRLDIPFRAAAECCEEAILNAMLCADAVKGYTGDRKASLRDWLNKNPLQSKA
jgi:D-aminopeptidase